MTSNIEINHTHKHEKIYLLFGPLASKAKQVEEEDSGTHEERHAIVERFE
jgi:hypothetical protein